MSRLLTMFFTCCCFCKTAANTVEAECLLWKCLHVCKYLHYHKMANIMDSFSESCDRGNHETEESQDRRQTSLWTSKAFVSSKNASVFKFLKFRCSFTCGNKILQNVLFIVISHYWSPVVFRKSRVWTLKITTIICGLEAREHIYLPLANHGCRIEQSALSSRLVSWPRDAA